MEECVQSGCQGQRSVAPLIRRVTRLLALVVAALVLAPAPASAHATLLFTSPAVDGAVPESPMVVQLVFDQPIVSSRSSLALTSSDGDAERLGDVEQGEDASAVRAEVLHRLPAGEYRVEWQVVAQDGDTMVGDFRFVVGSASALTSGSGDAATRGAWPLGVLRWLLFAGFATTLGGVVAARLVRRVPPGAASADPAPWLKSGAVAALLAAFGIAVLVAGAGSVADGLQAGSLLSLPDSTPGLLALVEFASLVLALAALALGRRGSAVVALAGVPVAEGLRAHPQAASGGWGFVVIAVHLTAIAIWVGALLHVIRVAWARRRRGLAAAPVVRAYARMAIVLVLVVIASGVVAGLAVIPRDDWADALFQTRYGRWLLIKLGFVTLAVTFAAWARRHLVRQPTSPQPSRAARAELGALAAVLALSSVLTVLAPPTSGSIPLAAPPPDAGPAIGLGTRAGAVGIAVSASQGQLVVNLSTPNTPDARDRPPDAMDLAGNVAGPNEETQRLEFRRCGLGCFVAPATWQRGDNVVTFRVDDERWGGGRAAVKVAWPPRPADRLLQAAVDRMRSVAHFTLHEQVTSDTATGLGDHMRIRLSGQEYLAAGPFGSGRAATVTRYDVHSDGQVTLALAYPAERVFVLLTVDRKDRIVREVLTSGEHLVTRTLVYDEAESHESHQHGS